MIFLIKILYFRLRFWLKYFFSKTLDNKYCDLIGKKKCLVFLAADYGNLGDVAITYAQEHFLTEHFPDYEIVDVPISNTLSHLKTFRHICSQFDIITVVGGGNMSDLYFDIELLRQLVIKVFHKNKVILFPQTMFFSKTLGGKYLRFIAAKTYSRHNNLIITARERWSYAAMKEMFPSSKLIPDIVMTLDKRNPFTERKGVTLCLRNDAESDLSQEFKMNLKKIVSESYDVIDYDTHIRRGGLSLDDRESELNKIWAQFRSSEWVITDRLHGMIFAYITSTPCIVLPNNNYKIEGCYSWIKNCGYIFFLDETNIGQLEVLLQRKVNNVDFESVHQKITDRTSEIL